MKKILVGLLALSTIFASIGFVGCDEDKPTGDDTAIGGTTDNGDGEGKEDGKGDSGSTGGEDGGNSGSTGGEDSGNSGSTGGVTDPYTEGLTFVEYENGYEVKSYTGTDAEVVIPKLYNGKEVIRLGSNLFYNNATVITSVSLPDSILSIDSAAFAGCTGLTGEFALPNSVTEIGSSVFYGCSGLTSITIPDGVTSIPAGAFMNCTALESLSLPSTLTHMETTTALYGCDNLQYTTYGTGSYLGNADNPYVVLMSTTDKSNTSCLLNGEVKIIYADVFSKSTMSGTLTIPEGVRYIGAYAFSTCNQITDVVLPETLIGLGNNAFYNCDALTGVDIPDNVTKLGGYVFAGCDKMTNITIGKGLTSLGLYAFAITAITNIVIPDNVTIITSSAFEGNDKLTTVVIGSGVEKIVSRAFYSCDALQEVYYCGTQDKWNAITKDTGNEDLLEATIYYYSATEAAGCWHYVNGVPTPWNV